MVLQAMNKRKKGKEFHQNVIGVLPAGGRATRISPLPCSKEVYPIGFRPVREGNGLRPKAVCHYLLEKMRIAGVTKAYLVLGKGKWDIPAYLGDGTMLDMHLAYLIMGLPFGVPYTLDQAYPFVRDNVVVFGFPDIIFEPDDVFVRLLDRQAATKADVVLGLFRTRQPQQTDMVDFDPDGRVRAVVIKPRQTQSLYTWTIAAWTPVLTEFMHEYVHITRAECDEGNPDSDVPRQRELSLGNVMQAAIGSGLRVDAVLFHDNFYLDIGTPEDLVQAIRDINLSPSPDRESI